MRFHLTLLAIVAASSASATDQDVDISRAIQKCWNTPAGVEGRSLSSTFEVQIGEDGSVTDITATDTPKGNDGKVFTLSASRAIERCAPYSDLPKGKVKVTFKTPIGKAPIDPFK
ncbi:hypothetical protein H9643_18800 [Ochrobactrum sp. Sa2BUA5]|nr:hypothetical protein [Ochrobactrum gallinarum]